MTHNILVATTVHRSLTNAYPNDRTAQLDRGLLHATRSPSLPPRKNSPSKRGGTAMTSLRRIAQALDKPPELIPARYSAVRPVLARASPSPHRAHRQDAAEPQEQREERPALAGARKGHSPARGALDGVMGSTSSRNRALAYPGRRFSSLMRFCSANSIEPVEVDEAVVDRFMAYRSQTGKPSDDAFRRRLARAWNSNVGKIPGWPVRQLVEPPVKAAAKPAWEEFPEGLRRDVDRYLESLTGVRRSQTGRRLRPQKPSTIRQRRAELSAAARMAVKSRRANRHAELIVCTVSAGRGGEDLGRLLASERRYAQGCSPSTSPASFWRSREKPNA